MPGIVGLISRQPAGECERRVAAMVRCLEHERFYVSGTRAFPELGIYAGWVAQTGSLAANQVFENETADIALLFSGECFVAPETRAELTRQGHQLGERPGDWLVHQYEELGEKFFESLNGLFSGLLIDQHLRRAFLFNDRYGMERIYFCETPDGLYFASEAKALLRVLPETRAFDEEGVAEFLTYGCTLNWRTLFRGVQLAPGGSLWRLEGSTSHRTRYFSPTDWERQPALSEQAFQTAFSETFRRVLPRYFESGSPVGISLTGGLDTRMIMAALPPLPAAPVCYTFAGANPGMLDARVAGEVARACGLRHELLRIGPDFFSAFAELADRTVYATDGCFGVLGAHEIYLNAQARQRSPVRLTGNYGSEVLRSVSTFKPLGLAPELFNPEISRAADPSRPGRSDGAGHPVGFAAFQEIPWNLFGTLSAGRSQVTFRTPYLDNEIVALAFRAPPGLRTSSRSAVQFVNEASPRLGDIPTDRGYAGNVSALRRLMRRAYAEVTFKLDYMCSEGLPLGLSVLDPFYQWCNARLGVQGLHKHLTYRNWLQKELVAFAEERLAEAGRAELPFLNAGIVRRLAHEHNAGQKNYTREINAVLTLEAVQRLLLRPGGLV